jgi:hypothetical protein
MKQITLKGLADFMTATPATQRKIVRQFKYPDDGEARVRIGYYRPARERIALYHGAGLDGDWLIDEVEDLALTGKALKHPLNTQYAHNAQVLQGYATHFATRAFQILDTVRLELQYDDLRVSVVPDLHVWEKGRNKIIKLGFMPKAPTEQMIKVITQGMYEAASIAELGLKSADILFFDVRRGDVHKGARIGARLKSDIEAACQNISAIWDSID